MKFLIKLFFLFVLVLTAAFFAGRYRFVRTSDGFHLLKKEKWALEGVYVDTRDWSVRDYFSNKEISRQLASLEWENLRDKASEQWRKIENQFSEIDLSKLSKEAKAKAESARTQAEQQFAKWQRQLDDGEINKERFMKEMENLEKWLTEEIEKIKS